MIPPFQFDIPPAPLSQPSQGPMEVYFAESLVFAQTAQPIAICCYDLMLNRFHPQLMPIKVSINVDECCRSTKEPRLKKAVRQIANDYGWEEGEISLAIVNDATIQTLNRQHLRHDYPTDVISFDLTEGDDFLEGEIIASIEMADAQCTEHGWSGDDELLLYIIHGMLHVIGLNDKSSSEKTEMTEVERWYLREMGVQLWESHRK